MNFWRGNSEMDARRFHESLIVVDGHCDTALDVLGLSYTHPGAGPRDILRRGDWGHVDVPRLKEGGVSCQIMALFADDAYVAEARAHTWRLIEVLEKTWARSDDFFLARGTADIERAKAEGKVAALLSIEGAEAIGESIEELHAFYDRGVRLMGLTWNRRNALGRGAGTGDPAVDGTGGLTEFGKRVVREMEELGMVVDASHLSDEALDDLLALARRPVIASHSNSRAVHPHRRNLRDEQAAGIAATGGLVGVTFPGVFVDSDPARVTKERVLEHLERLIEVAGPDHVGLGSDFDGFTPPYGVAFSSPAELPWITEALLKGGYSPETVAKVMGGNWMRVLGDIIG